MSASRSRPPSALHRRFAVETPEHVRLDYALADVGSRAAALAIDVAALASGLLLLTLAAGYAQRLGGIADALGTPLFVLGGFALAWGYFMLFEALGGGRTPGKRAVGLRVVHTGGESLSLKGSALRNLLRVVDMQPLPTGLVGAVSILATRRAQRLGDVVAGTIVVRDSGGSGDLGVDPIPQARTGRPLLANERFDLLAGYAARREGLDPTARRRVSQALWRAFEPTVGRLDDAETADERLVRLYAEEAPRHAARRGGASLQAAAMASARADAWKRYVALVRKATERGLARLSEEDARAFGRLYRGVVADLARARTYGASPGLAGTLERWAGAGHNLLYRSRGRTAFSPGRWLRAGFPASVRRHGRLALLAALCLFGPAALTYVEVRRDPLLGRSLVSADMLTRAENTEKGDPNARYLEADVAARTMPALASQLMANNAQVTFLAFAGGLLAGVGTLWILLVNGMLLGSVAGAYANEGVLPVLLAFVSPHGAVELGAICVAGGAGFALAAALLRPGRRTRLDALRERSRDAVSLLGGAAAMLAAAGLVEGFYSPSAAPAAGKFAFGVASAALLTLYFALAGRRADARRGRANGRAVRAIRAP